MTDRATSGWHNITLTLKNNCGKSVDLQNSTITFNTANSLNTSFWGTFGPLSYPDNNLQITSTPQSSGGYLASLSLHFPEASWAKSALPDKSSFTILFGSATGTHNPSSVKVYANATPVQIGKLDLINTTAKPSGVTQNSAIINIVSNGQVVSKVQLPWAGRQQITGLSTGSYNIQPEAFSDSQGNSYQGTAAPATLTVVANQVVSSSISYVKIAPVQDTVTLQVSGLPSTTNAINVLLTPTNASSPVSKNVNIANGTGADTVNLNRNIIYTVSSTAVPGYNTSFLPQPLTAKSGASEVITYQKQTTTPPVQGGSRIIGYLPGWKTPPSAASLANAGYTNILVAFGVFSTSNPGQIVSAFDTVSKEYITSLKNAGIKVSLSLGGASSSIPNTTTDFHQVLSARDPAAFQQTFVQSVESLVAQYGFDGVDIDIEHGLGDGTFTNPTGDIGALKNIINQLHANNPNLIISLAPQVANIAATPGFDATWGNYASLVMATHNALSWVGIQLYNTGCAFGIDNFCYDPNLVQSPNFSVAMATDLLENWPSKDPLGRLTGFQAYISSLNPSQVVLGYPAPDASGNHDGGPVTPTATIKRAIQCLRTAVAGPKSCDTYIPPRAYPGIGGVFNWEVTYDQNNNFRFATDLNACVKTGAC
jgi:chitinase